MPTPTYKITFDNEQGYYLAGNPMTVGLWPDSAGSARYRVYTGVGLTTLLFEGAIYSPGNWANVDISSLFASYKNTAGVLQAKIVLVTDAGTEYGSVQYTEGFLPIFTVFGGAISKLLIRRLATLEANIFDWKLKNSNTNFFLTTRTNDFVICIPENELMPLYYYGKGMVFTISTTNDECKSYDFTADADESLKSIDFETLRTEVAEDTAIWINEFRITTTDGWSCTVLITEAEPSDYAIKFRNSWGAWEKLSIHDNARYLPTFSESELTEKYDAVIQGLTTANERKTLQNIYQFVTSYKTQAERMFVIDMLLSAETYIVANNTEYEVIVTANSTQLAATTGEPMNVDLTLTLVDSDTVFSAILSEIDFNPLTTSDSTITTDEANILI